MRMEEQAEQLAAKEDECQRLKSQIEASLSEFDRYDPDIKTFIIEHVGIVGDQYCLKKRVDSLWFQELKKKEVIIFDDSQYLFVIQT